MIHHALKYMLLIIFIFMIKLFIKYFSIYIFLKFPVSVLLILDTCITEASRQQALAYFYFNIIIL